MNGYAIKDQIAHGINFRQYSRAYLIEDIVTSKRVLYINLDIQGPSQSIKKLVIDELKKITNFYDYDNVAISCSHVHSGNQIL
jgi:hypothetical protein